MFTLKLKTVISSLVLAVLFAVLTVTNYQVGAAPVYFNGSVRKLPIYSVGRNDNKIAISFDCAYGDEYTDGLLETLKLYDVNCTFFTVEFWVKKYPDKVKKIVDYGNEIGTHSATHPKMSKLSKDEMVKELTSSVAAIEGVTGKKVEVFRPPYGDYNDLLIETAASLNLYSIQWDVDSLDWKNLSAKQIVNRIVGKTKSGSIILCHNNGLHTLEALPYVLGELKQKGYKFVKISDLIYKDNYEINSFGKQIKKTN